MTSRTISRRGPGTIAPPPSLTTPLIAPHTAIDLARVKSQNGAKTKGTGYFAKCLKIFQTINIYVQLTRAAGFHK